ncbi:MAG: hypothetical protein IPI53_16345 [Saprospiraceae bacterium]|nr:hypothetical protein [Saprospiraceae bacterium]
MILQGITDLPTDRLFNISPEGGAYGGLIVLLCTVIFILYKRLSSLETEYKELVNAVHDVSKETVRNLTEIQNHNEVNVTKLSNLLERVLDKLKDY